MDVNRLCMVLDLDEVSHNRGRFLWNDLHWAAWPWGKEHCGKLTQTVYESIFAESNEKPYWNSLPIQRLYGRYQTVDRDLVGFIGEDETFCFLTNVAGIPCINLKPFGCKPFKPKLCVVEYPDTSVYHSLLIKDLENWQQETFATLTSLTNAMSALTLDSNQMMSSFTYVFL